VQVLTQNIKNFLDTSQGSAHAAESLAQKVSAPLPLR
jgi:hypothetical protein